MVEKGVPLERILVVTFTEKATGESKERLRKTIGDALSEERETKSSDVATIARLQKALDEFDDAPIFTIHGFCQRA